MKGERIVVETKFAKENDGFCVFSPYLRILEEFLSFHDQVGLALCVMPISLREPCGGRPV